MFDFVLPGFPSSSAPALPEGRERVAQSDPTNGERSGSRGGTNVAPLRTATSLGLLLAIASPAPASANEVWLGGVDNYARQLTQPGAPSDYTELFRVAAPWQRAAANIQVFETSSQFIERASNEDLTQMISDLRSRHVALGLAALMQTGHNGCGRGVEGYMGPGFVESLVSRVKKLGGELSYVVMDEPLWFGHHYDGPNACRDSIQDVAKNVAVNVAAVRRIFPAAKIGETEPIASPLQPGDWLDEILTWTAAYRAATGEDLAFLQADVDWKLQWHQQFSSLAPALRAKGIKFGIIYDGDPSDPNGAAWTRHAEARFIAVESDPASVPDQAVLYSWMTHPLFMLPETQPGTMTWLVNRYAAAETHVAVQRTGGRLTGQLTGADGRPLAAQPVRIFAVDDQDSGAPAEVTQSGTVPKGATAALFALRANAECQCSGPVNVTVGSLVFRNERTGEEVQRTFSVRGSAAVPGGIRIVARPGEAVTPNTPTWPVTPGDPWTIHVHMGASAQSVHSGYVALIFTNGTRVYLPFAPAEQAAGEVTTDDTGHFSFVASAALLRLNPGFRAEYSGSELYRMSTASIP